MTEPVSPYGRSFLVEPQARPGAAACKFADPPLGDGLLGDLDKYFDPAHARVEFDRLFARTWLCAGRASDLAKAGDWLRFDIGAESVIVSRQPDGTLRAYYNVCHHRGARLVTDDFGHGQRFVCGFHSWTWNLDGSLHRITDRETFDSGTICDNPPLSRVHVDEWGGFVFISMHGDPPPLTAFLDVLPAQLDAYRMQDMVVIADLSVEWEVNWKTALDAFMEGYHIHRRHPEGLGWIDDYHLQHDLFANGHSRMILPVAVKSPRLKDQDSLNDELRAMLSEVGLDPAAFEGRARDVRGAIQQRKPEWARRVGMDYGRYSPSQLTDDWNYFVFPNLTFNLHAEGMLVMRFRPHPRDVERCYYDVMVLAHRVADPHYRLPRYMGAPDVDLSGEVPRPPRARLRHGDASLGMVLDQDAEFVPRVQQGMRSRGFKGIRLSRQERRVRAFYEEYDRYLRDERS